MRNKTVAVRDLKRPELVFANRSIVPLLESMLKQHQDTLILVDPYNQSKVQSLTKKVEIQVIHNNLQDQLDGLRQRTVTRIIAVGGCTVLDIARAASTTNQELILIPSILSTACISVDRAVVRLEGKNTVLCTRAPDRTVVSLPWLLETEPKALIKWSQSGFADVFARLGASMDLAYQTGSLNLDIVVNEARNSVEQINWVLKHFRQFDEDSLRHLAVWSHNASLNSIDGRVSVGGEHALYYSMMDLHSEYTTEKPTHGQLVGVGTLLEAKLFAELSGDKKLFELLRDTYRKLGLPLTVTELTIIGISKQQIIVGLEAIGKGAGEKTLLQEHSERAIALLDNIFSEVNQTVAIEYETDNHFTKVGLEKAIDEIKARHHRDYPSTVNWICDYIRKYWESNGRPKLILGLSGGLDSSVVTYLAVKAVGKENVLPITMPSRGEDVCILNAEIVRNELGISEAFRYLRPIDKYVQLFREENPEADLIDLGNFASRRRVAELFYIARKFGGRVLGTGNRTEFVQGYAAKYGTPISCDFGILDSLYKTDIRELAKLFSVPEQIIGQKPTTGYYEGQTHEEELGATVDEQDAAAYLLFEKGMMIDEIVRGYGASRSFLQTMSERYLQNEHKRKLQQEHVRLSKMI